MGLIFILSIPNYACSSLKFLLILRTLIDEAIQYMLHDKLLKFNLAFSQEYVELIIGEHSTNRYDWYYVRNNSIDSSKVITF